MRKAGYKMKSVLTVLVILVVSIFLLACQSQHSMKIESIGDSKITVFDDTKVYFDLGLKELPESGDILRLDAGRVILKEISFPTYQLQPTVTANITLRSNGDPWDKSGSLFVIPKGADLTLIDFESDRFDLKSLDLTYPAISLSSAQNIRKENIKYQPNVELIRFMTPFGVGYFNNHERTKDRKPIYIPKWEDSVSWSQDITHLLPLLEGEVYVGVYIDTWDSKGYSISVSLDFDESTIENHKKKKSTVLPLVNSVKYAADQRHYDGFAYTPLVVDFTLPDNAKNAQLYYITTGHGGHSSGDEFVKRDNIISIDGEVIRQFIPWRDDCASFRRFNPSSGTWQAKDIVPNSTSIERIASSDFSRSNWCPGSDVVPDVMHLNELSGGKHRLEISIPEAQAAKENEHNYWMVSAYLTYESTKQ